MKVKICLTFCMPYGDTSWKVKFSFETVRLSLEYLIIFRPHIIFIDNLED